MVGRHDEALHRRVRWPLVLLAAVLIYGVAGYMLMGWSFVDALHMTIITLTTVGFREVLPLDDAGKIFTISVMVLGVALLLITLTLAAVWVAEGVLTEHRRWRRTQRRIASWGKRRFSTPSRRHEEAGDGSSSVPGSSTRAGYLRMGYLWTISVLSHHRPRPRYRPAPTQAIPTRAIA